MVARFATDRRGAVLRDYAVAVIIAAVTVIVAMTLMAEPLYRVYMRVFGP